MESDKRTSAQIQEEYTKFMAELGQLTLQHMEATEALARMNPRMDAIRTHAAKLKQEHAATVLQEAKDAGNTV